MNEWKEVKFGKLFLEPVRNGIYKSSEFQGKGIKIVNMKELFGFEFIGKQGMRKIELNQIEKSKFLLKEGDLLFARRSIVESGAGKTSIVKDLNGEMTFESSIIRMRLNQLMAFPLFYYYYLSSGVGRSLITALSSGTNVKGIKGSDLKNVDVLLPPLPTQRKIASILSAYDDLVENNLRRIKLLEELAQRTYEEWFVKFTIHGKKLPVNEETGLPEGWVRKKLGEVANLTMGQSPKSEFYNSENNGLPFHQGVKDYGFRFPTNSTWSSSGNRYAKENDILFSVRAPVGRINIAIEDIILGRGLAAINHKGGFTSFLFYQLQKIFFKEDLMGGGAIFNSVTKSDVQHIDILQPNKIILERFNKFSSNIDTQIKKLTIQNRLLKESRDILLPRLMNGTINVEAAEEQMMVAAEPEVKYGKK